MKATVEPLVDDSQQDIITAAVQAQPPPLSSSRDAVSMQVQQDGLKPLESVSTGSLSMHSIEDDVKKVNVSSRREKALGLISHI